MILVRLLALLVLPVVGLVVVPPASALSCAGPTAVAADSEALFTGRIRDYRGERFLVEVEEIWRGEVPARLWLATDDLGYWSDMKTFRSGTIPDGYASEKIFVFAPHRPTNRPLAVNVCTMWDSFTPWGTDLRDLRPEDPLRPAAQVQATDEGVLPPEADDRSRAGLLAGIGSGALLAALGATLAWRRRRTD